MEVTALAQEHFQKSPCQLEMQVNEEEDGSKKEAITNVVLERYYLWDKAGMRQSKQMFCGQTSQNMMPYPPD